MKYNIIKSRKFCIDSTLNSVLNWIWAWEFEETFAVCKLVFKLEATVDYAVVSGAKDVATVEVWIVLAEIYAYSPGHVKYHCEYNEGVVIYYLSTRRINTSIWCYWRYPQRNS